MALAAGLTGAGALSQFPEFSQQYVQRLGGAVHALEQVVADFDASAQAEGLSRADALASMVGSDFVARRRADMERTIERFDRLSADLAHLQRPGAARHSTVALGLDPALAKQTWAAFQPAMPLTYAGIGFGAAGFALGVALWGIGAGAFRVLTRARWRRA